MVVLWEEHCKYTLHAQPALRWGYLSEMTGQPSIQQAFQIRTRTKHFGINTMYSLFSQIYKIYISSFAFSFSFIYIELIV